MATWRSLGCRKGICKRREKKKEEEKGYRDQENTKLEMIEIVNDIMNE